MVRTHFNSIAFFTIVYTKFVLNISLSLVNDQSFITTQPFEDVNLREEV